MRGSWDDLQRRLVGGLPALDLGDVLTIGEFVEAPRRLFRRQPEQQRRRWLQVTATRGTLIAECVGSTSFGGEWAMGEETEAALVAQGWERPWSSEFSTFNREVPVLAAPRLARAIVRALQTLGCETADLEIRLSRDEEAAGG